jgi:hypothetical protein
MPRAAALSAEPRLTPVEVLPPDVNESGWKFTADRGNADPLRPGRRPRGGLERRRSRSSTPGRTAPSPRSSTSSPASTLRALNKRACEALDRRRRTRRLRARAHSSWRDSRPRTRRCSPGRPRRRPGQESLFGGGHGWGSSGRTRPSPRPRVGGGTTGSSGRRRRSASTSPATRSTASATSSAPSTP